MTRPSSEWESVFTRIVVGDCDAILGSVRRGVLELQEEKKKAPAIVKAAATKAPIVKKNRVKKAAAPIVGFAKATKKTASVAAGKKAVLKDSLSNVNDVLISKTIGDDAARFIDLTGDDEEAEKGLSVVGEIKRDASLAVL